MRTVYPRCAPDNCTFSPAHRSGVQDSRTFTLNIVTSTPLAFYIRAVSPLRLFSTALNEPQK